MDFSKLLCNVKASLGLVEKDTLILFFGVFRSIFVVLVWYFANVRKGSKRGARDHLFFAQITFFGTHTEIFKRIPGCALGFQLEGSLSSCKGYWGTNHVLSVGFAQSSGRKIDNSVEQQREN